MKFEPTLTMEQLAENKRLKQIEQFKSTPCYDCIALPTCRFQEIGELVFKCDPIDYYLETDVDTETSHGPEPYDICDYMIFNERKLQVIKEYFKKPL